MDPKHAQRNIWGRLLWALVVVLLASAIDASAQRTNGALKGVVTDPQGAVVPGQPSQSLVRKLNSKTGLPPPRVELLVFPSLCRARIR